MHFHLPKPPHGWREFFSEILVIVIGISIAIGAEQTVEWVHHRSEVREATEKLRAESIANRTNIEYDLSVLSNAITEVHGQIAVLGNCESAFDPGKLPPVGPDTPVPLDNTAWLALRDGALLPLMPAELVNNYSKLAGVAETNRGLGDELRTLRSDAGALVDLLRAGSRDKQACIDAAIKLRRLKKLQLVLQYRTQFYLFTNEEVLRGKVLGIGSIREFGQQRASPEQGQD